MIGNNTLAFNPVMYAEVEYIFFKYLCFSSMFILYSNSLYKSYCGSDTDVPSDVPCLQCRRDAAYREHGSHAGAGAPYKPVREPAVR